SGVPRTACPISSTLPPIRSTAWRVISGAWTRYAAWIASSTRLSSAVRRGEPQMSARQPFPRERRQVLAELHCVDSEPPLEQRERGVARPAADLERVGGRGHEDSNGI